MVVHDLASRRPRLIQVKAFSRQENKCPLIGVEATFENIDEVLRGESDVSLRIRGACRVLRRARFYILVPRDVRRLAKETYMK